MKKIYKLLALTIIITSFLLSACNKKEIDSKASNSSDTTITSDTLNEDKNSNSQIAKEEKQNTANGEFSKFTAPDLDKNEYDQDLLKSSKISVINVWGTFCTPCLKEMPELAELSKEYNDKDVQFIGIVIDTLDQNGNYSDNQIDLAKNIIKQTGVEYINLLPSHDLINSYLKTVQAIPVTLIVDSYGNVKKSYLGAKTKSFFEEAINSELNKLK